MIIACPECNTRYVVAPQAIGEKGRLVKCSRCEHTWFQEPSEDNAEIVPETVIEKDPPSQKDKDGMEKLDPGSKPEGPLRKNVPALVKERSAGIIAGWVILVLLVSGVGFSLYHFRSDLERTYPAAETLYAKWDYLVLGKKPKPPAKPEPVIEVIPHPASFLTMRQAMEIRMEDGFPTLVITLDIQNQGDQDITLPRFTGYLRDSEGNEVFSWPQVLDPATISAGAFQQYEIIVDKIPAEAAEAEIVFNWDE